MKLSVEPEHLKQCLYRIDKNSKKERKFTLRKEW